jgi:epoxyqueuosine reductase
MDPQNLTDALKAEALQQGFSLAGAAPVRTPPDFERLLVWLERGFAAGMVHFQRNLEAYRDPNRLLPGVKSVLMLAINYRTVEPAPTGRGEGRVSRFAWGTDYHAVIRRKLRHLEKFLRQRAARAGVRGIVDSAPFFERGFARRAGLGAIGKNNLLIHPEFGSWLFLAALLTTEELVCDPPYEKDLCGDCRRCLDACPTGALTAPYELDARRCISYLTQRREVPEPLRPAVGDRLFGCDTCQEVCPWNQAGPPCPETEFFPRPGMNPVELADLENLDEGQFRRRFRETPLRRLRREGLMRNVALVRENQSEFRSEAGASERG